MSELLKGCTAVHVINGGMVWLICDRGLAEHDLHHDPRHKVFWASQQEVADAAR